MSAAAELLEHITAARWFGGHRDAARLLRVHRLPWLRRPGDWPAVRLEIAEIDYPEIEEHDFYQLLVSYRPDHGDHSGSDHPGVLARCQDPQYGELIGTSGDEDPAARDALLVAFLDQLELDQLGLARDAGQASVSFGRESGGERGVRLFAQLHPGLPSQVFAGEQSNTSTMYAHLALLKLFRRLDVGNNPDIEIHRALTRSGNTDIATLLGTATGCWTDPETRSRRHAELAMLIEQLPDARDGWEFALARLRAGDRFDTEAERLGRALARIHHLLRAEFGTGTGTVDGNEITAAMTRRLDEAVDKVPELAPYQSDLGRIFSAVGGRRLPAQRVHGDFHLGQCLHTAQGWKIIDFEGEPLKSLAERSRPDSPLRDIAGALRSIDYAAAHAPAGVDGRTWAETCRTAFLHGYAGEQDHLGHDAANPDTAVLAAYQADKAIYEVVYESRHRPDWISIPLAAVRELARAPDPPDR